MDFPSRKTLRLKDWDYGAPGSYFVTVCTRGHSCILSRIAVGAELAPPSVALTAVGVLAEEQHLRLPERFPALSVDRYVIMPNHIHFLMTIQKSPGAASCAPTDSIIRAVQAFKSQTTRLAGAGPVFQRSFYDHVIRNEEDYREIWEYIDHNPARWAEDRFYSE